MIVLPRDLYKCTHCGKEAKKVLLKRCAYYRYASDKENKESWAQNDWTCKHDGLACNECKVKKLSCATCGNGVEYT